ncbi:MAG: UDP-3-O-(3-hydroxymyristoyl)glucosamine N-acyltransferase [Planctomycetota bacterium]|nr:UDP-3-O-(3-hydroxymyristoyl)glucosamine N-acyltransferase [Planctomycetota bacterium]
MEKTLRELADFVGGEVYGDGDLRIKRVSPIEQALVGDITFIANPRYEKLLEQTNASAVIVSAQGPKGKKSQLRTDQPYLAFAQIQRLWHPPPARSPLDPGQLRDGVKLGKDPSIYPNATVCEGTTIGDRVVLHPGVYVGENCRLGDDVTIFPNAAIYSGTTIGSRVTIHSGTVIGSDGFGYAPEGTRYYKIIHAGSVVLEDDVEIGANCTIDRAVTEGRSTWIRRGTKIDNLVQVGHNVEIGEDCLIVSQVAIGGSARIENHVTLGGQVGVAGHITIGHGSSAGGQAGISKSLPSGSFVLGSPAAPVRRKRREFAALSRLPDLFQRFREMEAKLKALEEGKREDRGDER